MTNTHICIYTIHQLRHPGKHYNAYNVFAGDGYGGGGDGDGVEEEMLANVEMNEKIMSFQYKL